MYNAKFEYFVFCFFVESYNFTRINSLSIGTETKEIILVFNSNKTFALYFNVHNIPFICNNKFNF